MSEAMLSVENLSAWYGAARILYDLSFDVGRGEVVALMGRNGAGKSTTMKAVMGLMAQRHGVVRFTHIGFWPAQGDVAAREIRELLDEKTP